MTELKRAMQKAILKTVINEGTPALLGLANGELYFRDSAGNVPDVNRIWARVGVSDRPIEMVVYCSEIAKIRGLPVIVADRNGVPTVIRADARRADVFSEAGPGTVTTAPHVGTHGRYGIDPLYVSGAAFVPGMPRPASVPGLSVTVERINYRYGGANKSLVPTPLDLTAYMPTPVKQRFVIVSLNRTTNDLEVTASTPESIMPITPAVPFTSADALALVDTLAVEQYPLAAIRLYSGMTRINAQDIFLDLRLWAGEAGNIALDDLADVVITSPGTSAVLMWNGVDTWIDQQISVAHIPDFFEGVQDGVAGVFAAETGDLDFTYDDVGNDMGVAVKPNAINNSKMATMLQGTVKGRAAGAGTGSVTDLDGAMLSAILAGGSFSVTDITDFVEGVQDVVGAFFIDSADFDITYDDALNTITGIVKNDAITNAKLANMAQATIKGQTVGGSGDPVDLTAAQLNTIIGTTNLTMANGIIIASDEVRARDSGGLLLRADGSEYGINIHDSGNVMVGDGGTPATLFEVRGDTGGLTLSRTNASAVAEPFIRFRRGPGLSESGQMRGVDGGGIRWTDGSSATEWGRFDANGNLGVGVSGPQGKFHSHDGVSGFLFGTKTTVNGTPQVIIPNGTGDVTAAIVGNAVVTCNGSFAQMIVGIIPNNTTQSIVVGGSTFRLSCATNGEVSVDRTAGSDTAIFSYRLHWI